MRKDIEVEAINEQQRLVVAIAIIATALGLYTIDGDAHAIAVMLQVFVTLPSFFLGLYLVFSASGLKYKGKSELGDISVPEKFRRWTYDFGINLFGTLFTLGVIISIVALSGWDGEESTFLQFWPSIIISIIVLLAIMITMLIISEKEKSLLQKRRWKLFRKVSR